MCRPTAWLDTEAQPLRQARSTRHFWALGASLVFAGTALADGPRRREGGDVIERSIPAPVDTPVALPQGAETIVLDGMADQWWIRLSPPTMNYAEVFSLQEPEPDGFRLAHYNELLFEIEESDRLTLVELSVDVLFVGRESYIDLICRRRQNDAYVFRTSATDSLPTSLVRMKSNRADRVQVATVPSHPNGHWLRVGLYPDGDELVGRIDGEIVARWTDSTYDVGAFGLRAGFLPETLVRRIQAVVRRSGDEQLTVYRDLW